jgi:hypothetical protein
VGASKEAETWPLATLCARSTDHTTHRGGSGVCSVGDGGGTAIACNSRNTKLPELAFHAVLGDDTRGLRFERLLARGVEMLAESSPIEPIHLTS